MSLRLEFVLLATQPTANVRALCRQFGISPKTGYKWLQRYAAHGPAGLHDQSRRPQQSPARTPDAVEAQVVALRRAHPAWGGRKLAAVLRAQAVPCVPAPATVTGILRRHGLLDPAAAAAHTPYQRFEHPVPNALWQMDFKGHFALLTGRCHALTVLDDHSRFSLVLQACADERTATVQQHLITAFRRYGLPQAILCDHGSPWGDDRDSPYTRLGVWLLRLGVHVTHGRPYHPQTQGKEERFHRTLQAEVLGGRTFTDLPACQTAFDAWRAVYNLQRPHEALGLQPPHTRYQVSPRPYPESLPPIVYGPTETVRRVQDGGWVQFRGQRVKVSKAFRGYPVAIRPLDADDQYAVYFCTHRLGAFSLTARPQAD
jgi:transposase InsO family protein